MGGQWIKEIDVNTRNWIDSAQDMDYWSSLCECGIELPGSIRHHVILKVFIIVKSVSIVFILIFVFSNIMVFIIDFQ